jgi:hypothetical protein
VQPTPRLGGRSVCSEPRFEGIEQHNRLRVILIEQSREDIVAKFGRSFGVSGEQEINRGIAMAVNA